MLDIIVCSKQNNLMERSINVINMTLVNYEIDYHIHKFMKDNKMLDKFINTSGVKIYILDVDIGRQVASLIREKDFDSIIIFVSSNDIIKDYFFENGYMALDYICFDNNFNNRLRNTLNLSLKIIYRNNAFVFRYNHVVYRIPYMNITYIEKEAHVKRCIIHTYNDAYHIVSSIDNLNEVLGLSFFKTHQSCIINLVNIYSVDFINNIIMFNNGDKTSLLSEKNKKIIRDFIKI